MAFKLHDNSVPLPPSSPLNSANTSFYTVIDDDGTMTVDQLKLTGNSSALTRYARTSVTNPFTAQPFYGLYVGQFNGYYMGGTSSLTASTGSTSIYKFPFASATATKDLLMPGVLNAASVQTGRGTAKSSVKTYILGGTPDGSTAGITAIKVFPFAIGDTHGSYAIPAVLTAARKETQYLSNMNGGAVYVAGGGNGSPAYYAIGTAVAALTSVNKLPTASETGPVSSPTGLVTGRAYATGYSAPDKGVVSGGQNLLGGALLGSNEIFPWASETWSSTPAVAVAYKYAAGFQSTDTGYQAFGANNAPSYTQPNTTAPVTPGYAFKNLAVISFPFASVGIAVAEQILPTATTGVTVVGRMGMSGLYEGWIAGGWPGGASPVGSITTFNKYPYAGKVAIYDTTTMDKVDGYTSQD